MCKNVIKTYLNSICISIHRFLKAKVTILQQELDLSHRENTKNLDNLNKAIELQKKTEAARCHANNTINMLTAQIQKIQQSESNNALKLKVIFMNIIYVCFLFRAIYIAKMVLKC